MNVSEITIVFKGICTQLVGDSWVPQRPKLVMKDDRFRNVPHRVFVAYPELHSQLIDRCVPRHTPKYRLTESPTLQLPRVVLRIDGTVDEPIVYSDRFRALPSVWGFTAPPFPKPQPLPEALDPWTAKAQLLFDFYTGATFDADEGENAVVTVRIRPDADAELVWTEPGDLPLSIILDPGETVTITNFPDDEVPCTVEDYLLHYVPTDCDFANLPSWPRPDIPWDTLRQEKQAAYEGRKPNHEVYCANSVYP